MSLRLDENQIWVSSTNEPVSYPEWGHDMYFSIEHKSFWLNHRNNVILQIIKRFPFNGDFIDIGGGNGFQVQFLTDNIPNKSFILLEPGYSGCLNAKKRGLKTIYNTQFEDFPFDKYDVGGIGFFDVIEHIEDQMLFLTELLNRLKKGTHIYITAPAYNWLWSETDKRAKHYRRYDKQMLLILADACKLKLLFSSYFFSYLPPMIFLIRSIPCRLGFKRKQLTLKAVTKIHNTNKLFLAVINIINKMELKQLKNKGINFGSSCITVFRT